MLVQGGIQPSQTAKDRLPYCWRVSPPMLSMPFGFGQGKTSTDMAVFDGPACRAVEGVSVVLPAGKDGASVGVETAASAATRASGSTGSRWVLREAV